MNDAPPHLWSRLYRRLLRLLPADVRAADGDEMARTFDRLITDERSAVRRARRAFHALAGITRVALVERLDPLRRGVHDFRENTTMDRSLKDLRYAVRTLRRARSFSIGAVLLMAVGIGAVTAVFTLVDHVLLRPLPYPEPDRLVTLEEGSFPGPMVQRLPAVDAFESWAAGWSAPATLTGSDDPERIEQARVTVDFFDLFGANAVRGRLLGADDAAHDDRVVLSYGLWSRRWGADPDLVGRSIVIDGEPVTVVGVLDAAFSPPTVLVNADTDVWRHVDWTLEDFSSHSYHVLDVVGRLRPGATPGDAQAGVDALVARMVEIAPDSYLESSGAPWTIPVTPLQEVTVRGVRTGLGLLLGAVGLLLAVACTNVAHLFLARGLGRTREMAVRRALGAGTASLARQLTLEALVVGVLGGALGTGLAVLGLRAFRATAPALLPPGADVGVDLRILGFAAAISIATALVFGLLPAVRSLRTDPSAGLRTTGRAATPGRRLGVARSGMLVAEVALSMVLLAGSGLLMRSFLSVRSIDPGLAVDGLWSVPLTPTDLDTPERWVRGTEALRVAVAGVPGVESAALALELPFSRTGRSRCCWTRELAASDHDGDDPRTLIHVVSAGYFRTLGIEMVAGRSWDPAQQFDRPVPAVVTASTAVELWGGPERALGRTLSDDDGVWTEIVGVAADNRHFGLDQDQGPAIYVPTAVVPFAIPLAEIAVRLRGDRVPDDFGRAIREAIWSVSPAQPIPTLRSMREMVDASTATRRFDGIVFTLFGTLALLLAAGGLYGTLLFTVGERRRELGIRLALGADRRVVEGHVMAGGLLLAAVGVSLGLAASWFAARLLESRLWGIEAGDPLTLAGAALLLLAVAALASWLPARRAARTDPVATLKAE